MIDIEKFTYIPDNFNFHNSELLTEKQVFEEYKTQNFLLTNDCLILKNYLNNDIVKELKSVYFKTCNLEIRRSIIEGLFDKINSHLIPKHIVKRIKFVTGFFPVSMSRLYSLKRMGIEDSNVLATNIYDISDDPLDSAVYLKAAVEKTLPIILQVSLNAAGQSEHDALGNRRRLSKTFKRSI